MEQFVDDDAYTPTIRFRRLGLTHQHLRSMIKSHFFLRLLFFGESQLHVLSVDRVEVHDEDFFRTQTLDLALLEQFKSKFYQFQRDNIFDFSRGVLDYQVAKLLQNYSKVISTKRPLDSRSLYEIP